MFVAFDAEAESFDVRRREQDHASHYFLDKWTIFRLHWKAHGSPRVGFIRIPEPISATAQAGRRACTVAPKCVLRLRTGAWSPMESNGVQWSPMEPNGVQWSPIFQDVRLLDAHIHFDYIRFSLSHTCMYI